MTMHNDNLPGDERREFWHILYEAMANLSWFMV
jgi:hypothetical protein